MTNELIAEARKFLATPNLGKDMARELNKALIYIWRLADALESAMIPHAECEASGERAGAQLADLKAALEAAEARIAELEAGEWEYGIAVEGLDGMPEPRPTREAAQHVIDHPDIYRKWTHGNPVIMHRRRKAGPWVPVESEGE